MLLIPQEWSYEGVVLPVGQPELVATAPAYRRRGLIREQFADIHRRSEALGDRWQVIGGIPWYYRQLGYTYALDLPPMPIWRPPAKVPDPPDGIALRAATLDDMPAIVPQRFAVGRAGADARGAEIADLTHRHDLPTATMRNDGRVALPWETVVCSGRPPVGPLALSTPSVVA